MSIAPGVLSEWREVLTRRMPLWLSSPWLPLLLTAGAYGSLAVVILSTNAWDASIFVTASTPWWNPASAPWSLQTLSGGYDGQWYYALALSPLGDPSLTYFDDGAYRAGRILLPFLSWVLAGGRPERIAYAMILTNFLALCNLGYVGGAYARSLGRHAAWGILFPCTTGLLITFFGDLTEILATSLVVSALLCLRRRQFRLATLAACGAALSRETTLLVSITAAGAYALARLPPFPTPALARGPSWVSRIAAGGLSLLNELRENRSALKLHFLLLPFLAYGAWQGVVRHQWGAFSASGRTQTMGALPFASPLGYLAEIDLAFTADTLQRLFFFIFVIFLLALIWRSRATLFEKLLAVSLLAFVSQLGVDFWIHFGGFGRSLSELYAVGLIVLLGARSVARYPVLLLTGALWVHSVVDLDQVAGNLAKQPQPWPEPAATPVDRLAVDLLAKRTMEGGAIVDVGDASAWMYLLDGWYDDGRTVSASAASSAWLLGEQSFFHVSLWPQQAHELRLVLGTHHPAVEGRRLLCSVNGPQVAELKLEAGVRSYRVEIPAELVQARNWISFRLTAPAAGAPAAPAGPIHPVTVHAIIVQVLGAQIGELGPLARDALARDLLTGGEARTDRPARPLPPAPLLANLGDDRRREVALVHGWGAEGRADPPGGLPTSWREILGPTATIEVDLPPGRDHLLQVVAQPTAHGRRRRLGVSLNGQALASRPLADQLGVYSFDLPAGRVLAHNELRLRVGDQERPDATDEGSRRVTAEVHVISIQAPGAQVAWPSVDLPDSLARDLLRKSLPAVQRFVDIGDPAARDHLLAGWAWEQQSEYLGYPTSWTWITGRRASLEVELEPRRAHALGVVIEPFWEIEALGVELRVNGAAVHESPIGRHGATLVEAYVPAEVVGARNEVVIELGRPPHPGGHELAGARDLGARVFAVTLWPLP